jgi:hypothetical protein
MSVENELRGLLEAMRQLAATVVLLRGDVTALQVTHRAVVAVSGGSQVDGVSLPVWYANQQMVALERMLISMEDLDPDLAARGRWSPAMIHVTLNTGNEAILQQGMIWPSIRQWFAPIIAAGGGKLPGMEEGFRVEITPALGICTFSFFRDQEPLTVDVLCWSSNAADVAWQTMEKVYYDLSDKAPDSMMAIACPERPDLPWLATLILSPFTRLLPEEAGYLGHLAACFGLMLHERYGAVGK